jgi:sulfate/thiosulfate transport system ATP-binding protein
MAIEATGITKHFGDFKALDDVTVNVPDGSLTALLGPSGSGKSTLLRVIAGLEEPDSGSVRFGDRDVTSVSAQDRGVGFVFQHYAAFKHMTVRDNVAFGLKIRKQPKERIKARVDELLKLVHLTGWADRYPSQLSGGQRQRMALARALAVEPQVLLLDEPFGALDEVTRGEMQELLLKVVADFQTATVIITHDIDEALLLSDRVILLGGAPARQIGQWHIDLPKPREDYVAEVGALRIEILTTLRQAVRRH